MAPARPTVQATQQQPRPAEADQQGQQVKFSRVAKPAVHSQVPVTQATQPSPRPPVAQPPQARQTVQAQPQAERPPTVAKPLPPPPRDFSKGGAFDLKMKMVMRCPGCGKKLEDGNFCKHCGTKLG